MALHQSCLGPKRMLALHQGCLGPLPHVSRLKAAASVRLAAVIIGRPCLPCTGCFARC